MSKPSCFETFIKTGKGSKDDSGSQGRTVKKRSNQLAWERKGWDARQQKLSCMPLKVVDSCTTRSYAHTWIHFWHILCTNIITMTHSINSNANLLPIDITRTHTQMKKSLRGEKERRKEMRRNREQKIKKLQIKNKEINN